MSVHIPEQRQNQDLPLPGMPVHPLECAVEACTSPGAVRYFPACKITLCFDHFLDAAEKHRAERTYW